MKKLKAAIILSTMALTLTGLLCAGTFPAGYNAPSLQRAQPTITRVNEYRAHALNVQQAAVTRNPMKGFAGWSGETTPKNGYPYTIEYIRLPLNSVIKGEGNYDWSQLETALNAAKGRGLNSIVRFSPDIPAAPGTAKGVNTGIPQYLVDEGLVVAYDNKSYSGLSLNYTEERVMQCLLDFIEAFGTRYDGDPRLVAVEAGLIGHWGEWHISAGIPAATMYQYRDVIEKYEANFHTTHVMLRKAWMFDYRHKTYAVGLHNDLFGSPDYSADESIENLVKLRADKLWKEHPIGGELIPTLQTQIFTGAESARTVDFKRRAAESHTSFLLARRVQNLSGNNLQNAIEAASSLGYDLAVTQASYNEIIEGGAKIKLGVTIENRGIAPFYYKWPVEVQICRSGDPVWTITPDWDIRSVAAQGTKQFKCSINNIGLAEGEYTIRMRVSNAMEGGLPIVFANEEATADGWIDLAAFQVDE